MDTHILAIRAIAATLAKDILLPIIIVTGVVYALVIALLVYIAIEVGSILLLLLIPAGFIGLSAGVALLIVYRTVRAISPDMTKEQKGLTRDFISTLESYAELKSTPKFLIAWRVIMSSIKKSPKVYISSLINDSTKLKGQYSKLVHSFPRSKSTGTSKRKSVKNLENQ